jgi:hypothetical protein
MDAGGILKESYVLEDEYDDRGNWTVKVPGERGDLFYLLERSIDYFT